MEELTTRQKIENKIIDKLSKQKLDMIHRNCELKDVNAQVDKSLNRIVLFGHADDVSKAVGEICSIFNL